jgi:hypothetical protein
MELFLNLCWLSLLAPAYLLWRLRIVSPSACNRTRSSSVPPLVFLCVLGCALVLLFPVISASDDLHAMRAEIEELSPSKRAVCQSAAEKTSGWHNRLLHLCAVLPIPASLRLTSETRHQSLSAFLFLPVAPLILQASRAPPVLG